MSMMAGLFDMIKRKRLCVLLERRHCDSRSMTEWYPDWFYEIMERDEARNSAYGQAIRETVEGRSILEIGAGPHAFLSLMCANAGARQIVAIEANIRAFQSACDYVARKGIDRIRIIHGFSDQVDLEERPEVLVHELVGSIGSSEGMALFVRDAKQRLLSANTAYIPYACNTYLFPTEHPRLGIIERLLGWLYRGGRSLRGRKFLRAYNFPSSAALAEPQEFERIVFAENYPLRNQRRLVFSVTRDGYLAGFALFIRLFVSPERCVDSLSQATNWSVPYIRLYSPTVWVKQGSLIAVDVQSDLTGIEPIYTIEVAFGDSENSLASSERYTWKGA
jgi:hypothetical protein